MFESHFVQVIEIIICVCVVYLYSNGGSLSTGHNGECPQWHPKCEPINYQIILGYDVSKCDKQVQHAIPRLLYYKTRGASIEMKQFNKLRSNSPKRQKVHRYRKKYLKAIRWANAPAIDGSYNKRVKSLRGMGFTKTIPKSIPFLDELKVEQMLNKLELRLDEERTENPLFTFMARLGCLDFLQCYFGKYSSSLSKNTKLKMLGKVKESLIPLKLCLKIMTSLVNHFQQVSFVHDIDSESNKFESTITLKEISKLGAEADLLESYLGSAEFVKKKPQSKGPAIIDPNPRWWSETERVFDEMMNRVGSVELYETNMSNMFDKLKECDYQGMFNLKLYILLRLTSSKTATNINTRIIDYCLPIVASGGPTVSAHLMDMVINGYYKYIESDYSDEVSGLLDPKFVTESECTAVGVPPEQDDEFADYLAIKWFESYLVSAPSAVNNCPCINDEKGDREIGIIPATTVIPELIQDEPCSM